MNKKVIAIILGIMCVLLSCGIVMQVRAIEKTGSTMGTNSQENELRDAVLKSKEKYDNLYAEVEAVENKLESERKNATQNNTDLTNLENEIKDKNKVLGLSEVTGNGLIITINDNQDISLNSWLADPNLLIVHDTDLISVVNELKNAGAEAISINGIRVINMTDIADIDTYIIMKPSQRIFSPYIVKAIGNQTYLTSSLCQKNSGFVDKYNNSGKSVKLEKQRNIKIPKYSGNIEIKYMKEVTEK